MDHPFFFPTTLSDFDSQCKWKPPNRCEYGILDKKRSACSGEIVTVARPWI